MQLLDSPPTQLPDVQSARLEEALSDIASKIQIGADFSIRHPDYKPLELPPEGIARFQRMPVDLQKRYQSLLLCNFLYGIYYNSSLRSTLAPDEAASDGKPLYQDLENNTLLGVDLAFYDRLHESNRGDGYFAPGWLVVRQESDGSLAVTKGGLTLHVDREQHLLPDNQSAAVGEEVAIRMPKNLVQNGFYMAVGNAESQRHDHPDEPSEIVRIYFNLTPEGAVAVMAAITQRLNAIPIPFSFKVLYNPAEYKRYDSGVLYFQKRHYSALWPAIQSFYADCQAHFKPEIPLFTKQLAPGLGLAEEPDQKFTDRESFGTNRCQIIAKGLLEVWQSGDDSPQSRRNAILQHFSSLGIDWQRAYLNASSEDIYTPLDL